MKQIEKDIFKEESYIQSISKSEQMHHIDILFQKDTTLQELTITIKTLGEVVMSYSACNILIQQGRNKQAQIIVPPSTKHFDDISLKLKQTIKTNLEAVRRCTFLPDGRLVFASCNGNHVSVLKPDGSADINLNNIGPIWDVVYIGDNSVAVTSGGTVYSKQINIIDVLNRKVKKAFNVNSANYGVTFKDGKLIYCAGDQGLKMISLSNASITSITSSKMSSMANIATHGENLFYTNENNHNVTCCDFHGNTLWTFSESSVLNHPFGISVENDGNVYVAGVWTHNVVVITVDGQRHRKLLSTKDGLNCPAAVEYDRSNNKLLVANNNDRNAFVYDFV
ncbi:uncharacterized protein LOC127712734 [Mytilus californianus]|uniref:uncharacterized protein LOC127712734 n=1 Tax=Mytilus californianus TaxID=6549 RepID=UPI00224697FE|nr:uncharacterized protein LOC127712734 [Mytilus californianus]